ncbi:TetR/AcrR family transcriptional regulator [Arthrobacter sp. ISL-69]|uniref:TetR/AcrR family transcriptional regulator n=1 Tax=Arthrobacter sp. ISL-69 TaxID=2819113 RepID=UPI001BE5B16D|nr:TetR-like C-terminal domain-containing protein [Arthrobacter sp. ISL-69]MBT2537915.1 TetR/AcrR family transcriptional regulator [Arthrobacter sp. ISL-69]
MIDQPYHHGNLREALLARATEIIEEAGVEGLSLRQLARDLGVSHAAPGKHFRDKQALIDALALDGFREMNVRIKGASEADGDHRSRFVRIARAYVDFAVTHPVQLVVMHSTKHHRDASEELRNIGEAGMRIARGLIAEAQEAGELASGDAERLALVCFVSLHGAALLAAGDLLDGASVDDLTLATTDLLWAGMVAGMPAPHGSLPDRA